MGHIVSTASLLCQVQLLSGNPTHSHASWQMLLPKQCQAVWAGAIGRWDLATKQMVELPREGRQKVAERQRDKSGYPILSFSQLCKKWEKQKAISKQAKSLEKKGRRKENCFFRKEKEVREKQGFGQLFMELFSLILFNMILEKNYISTQ